LKPCPTCNGSGKVIIGYGVICTELVEKIAECSDCRGKGFISAGGRRKGRLDLAPSRNDPYLICVLKIKIKQSIWVNLQAHAI
jgi:hypothetical protein